MRPLAAAAAAATLLSLAPGPVRAQVDFFGQNKIQYNLFRWQILRGEHVHLYHYREEEELARHALALAEAAYAELRVSFRLEPAEPVTLVLYNSHHHFEQTNLIPYFLPEGVAGFTEYLRGRVALPFTGSYAELRQVIRHELVHVFQRVKIAETYRLHPRADFSAAPAWLSEGLAEYWSGSTNPYREMVLRDLTLNQRLPTVRELHDLGAVFAVYQLGQSLVAHIAAAYGEERLLLLYDSLWRAPNFSLVLERALGTTEEELTRGWHRSLEERYFPLVAVEEDVAIVAERAAGAEEMARMPAYAPPRPECPEGEIVYLAAPSGYVNVYARPLAPAGSAAGASGDGADEEEDGGAEAGAGELERKRPPAREVLRGEREERFESFHPGQSRMEVSGDGRLAVVSKFQDRDALYLLPLARDGRGRSEPQGPFHFEPLISLSSPSWSPDGARLVFAALDWSGCADLYLFTPASGALERLTADRFRDADPDWSPDGRRIVFSTDRGAGGDEGRQNLWLFDLAAYRLDPLTAGPWHDEGPRWSPDGRRILFTSDRGGVLNLWVCDAAGDVRPLTRYRGGALEADWGPGGASVLVTALRDSRPAIYRQTVAGDSLFAAPAGAASAGDGVAALTGDAPSATDGRDAPRAGWSWPRLPDPPAPLAAYRPRYSLEVAQGAVAYSMGGNFGEGLQALLSDALNDRVIVVNFSHTGESLDDFLSRLSLGVFYLNLAHRTSFGIGGFHYVGEYLDRRGFPFFQRLAGVNALGSYPFSRYHRLEGGFVLAHQDKSDFPLESHTRGLMGTSYLAFVRDTSLWGMTGPVAGERVRVALGTTLDLGHAVPENVAFMFDGRRYLGLGPRLSYAGRLYAGASRGRDPELFLLGGSWNLRGYRRNSLVGTRVFLLSHELRFPLLAPFGVQLLPVRLDLPGMQGALFVDAGNAWDREEKVSSLLGSVGAGARLGLGGMAVVRLDVAWPTDFERVESDPVVDVFFGWNF